MKTRKDVYEFAKDLLDSALEYKKGDSRLDLGSSGTHYSKNQIEVEGFLRLLWAAGPMQSINADEDFNHFVIGIVSGVDPESKNYWGKVSDHDQLLVEMAALALTLVVTKESFWDTLREQDKNNIYNWLNQINESAVHNNNWMFFRIMVNVAFIKLSLSPDSEKMEKALIQIDKLYLGNGWYMDGNEHQMDYYISWAFHYYGLIYAVFMREQDQKNCDKFILRAKKFAEDFKYWFDDSGAGIPFGRSLTYRFSQAAFWSALVYADVEAIPWSEIKYILLNHLGYWEKQNITKKDGTLSIGYAYENLYMSESYNGPGSPYWAFKTFLLLGVPKEHPFWTVEPRKPLKTNSIRKITQAKMLITHEEDGNAQLYPIDQYTNQAHAAEKYSKFVYSSKYGFSISKDRGGINAGAYDNILAVAEKNSEFYFIKERCQQSGLNSHYVWHAWSPIIDVSILSYIIPVSFGHVRIHIVDTKRPLSIADGGYAVKTMNSHKKDYSFYESDDYTTFHGENGYLASFNLNGYEQCSLVFPDPNTNLLYTNSALPTLTGNCEKGIHEYISAHFASENKQTFIPPNVNKTERGYCVTHNDKIVKVNTVFY